MRLGYQRSWKKTGVPGWVTYKNKRAQNVIRIRYEWFYWIDKTIIIKIEGYNWWKAKMHVINILV